MKHQHEAYMKKIGPRLTVNPLCSEDWEAVHWLCAAREGEGDGERDGVEADECLLGQVHHRHPREQVQLQRNQLPDQLRAAVHGHEHHHHEALPVHAVEQCPTPFSDLPAPLFDWSWWDEIFPHFIWLMSTASYCSLGLMALENGYNQNIDHSYLPFVLGLLGLSSLRARWIIDHLFCFQVGPVDFRKLIKIYA